MKKELEYPLFNACECNALKLHLRALPAVEVKAIVLRFWGLYSIQDIAGELRKSWDEADQILGQAIKHLRHLCASDPVFMTRLIRLRAA